MKKRLDYTLNLEAQIMGGNLDSLGSLPWDEKSFFVWNGDPFKLNSGSGYKFFLFFLSFFVFEYCSDWCFRFTEYAPTGWLLPYWMARYYGFISN